MPRRNRSQLINPFEDTTVLNSHTPRSQVYVAYMLYILAGASIGAICSSVAYFATKMLIFLFT